MPAEGPQRRRAYDEPGAVIQKMQNLTVAAVLVPRVNRLWRWIAGVLMLVCVDGVTAAIEIVADQTQVGQGTHLHQGKAQQGEPREFFAMESTKFHGGNLTIFIRIGKHPPESFLRLTALSILRSGDASLPYAPQTLPKLEKGFVSAMPRG